MQNSNTLYLLLALAGNNDVDVVTQVRIDEADNTVQY